MPFHLQCIVLAGTVIAAGGSSCAFAQQRPGTAVQLPTFSQFSIGTTVSVPDWGGAYLGGIKRSADSRSTFGVPLLPIRPFRNTAISSERSASSMHVNVWIHDFEAMDRYLLDQPSRGGGSGVVTTAPIGGGASRIAGPVDWASVPEAPAGGAESPLGSVAEERQRRARKQAQAASEAERFFERGEAAEAEGKSSVAKIYYRMAARRATGPLKAQLTAKLEAINRAATGDVVAEASR